MQRISFIKKIFTFHSHVNQCHQHQWPEHWLQSETKSDAILHILFVRPCFRLHCTLTPILHLSPGLLISSIICQGYLEDRMQGLCRENIMPASPFPSAAVLSDPIHFYFLHVSLFLSIYRGEEYKRGCGIFNVSRHSCCYSWMNVDSCCGALLVFEVWLFGANQNAGPTSFYKID